MRTERYAIYPGWVRSKNDGQDHFITASELAHLYGVRLDQCIVIEHDDYLKSWRRELIARASQLPGLWPRSDGDYTLRTCGVSAPDHQPK